MALSEKQQKFVLRFIFKSRTNLTSRHIFSALLEARGHFNSEGTASQQEVDQYIDFLFRKGVIERKNVNKTNIWLPTMYLNYVVNGVRELPEFISEHSYR